MPRHNTLFCSDCGCECMPWETAYRFNGDWYCSDCFDGIRSEQTLDEFADLIGSEHMTVEEVLYDD